MPKKMKDSEWEKMDEKALSTICLCLSKEVQREVLREKTATSCWNKLAELYQAKNLPNKLCLKERLYSTKMAELGMTIQEHIDNFNVILIDLENLDEPVKDEDAAVILLCSLSKKYRNFKEVLLYGNRTSLSLTEVKTALLAKDTVDRNDLDTPGLSGNKADGLFIASGQGSGNSNNVNYKGKFEGICHYCHKKGHIAKNCFKKQNASKKQVKKGKQPNSAYASVVEDEADCDILLVSEAEKRQKMEWILDSGC